MAGAKVVWTMAVAVLLWCGGATARARATTAAQVTAFCNGWNRYGRRQESSSLSLRTTTRTTRMQPAAFLVVSKRQEAFCDSRLYLNTFGNVGDLPDEEEEEEDDDDEDDDEPDVYRERASSEFQEEEEDKKEEEEDKDKDKTGALATTTTTTTTTTTNSPPLDRTSMDWGGAMDSLARRVQDVETGRTGPSQALFRVMTQEAPAQAILKFVQEANPQVVQAMSGAVNNLLGGLSNPLMGMDMIVKANGERLGNLCFQLQMTGYMFRNAEYVVALKKILNLPATATRRNNVVLQDYKEAFERVDADGSGYIESGEIELLLQQVSQDGQAPPAFEVDAFMKFFDSNQDGRISWEEFERGLLGAIGTGPTTFSTRRAQGFLPPTPTTAEDDEKDDEDDGGSLEEPTISGKIRVKLKSGKTIKIEAKEYLDSLQKEAEELKEALRRERQAGRVSDETAAANPLGSVMAAGGSPESAESSSEGIAGYIASLQGNVQSLTEGISPEVVDTMKLLVQFVLDGGPTGTGRALRERAGGKGSEAAAAAADWAKVEMEIPGSALQQLALWQLVLGYRLREEEATGEYRKLLE